MTGYKIVNLKMMIEELGEDRAKEQPQSILFNIGGVVIAFRHKKAHDRPGNAPCLVQNGVQQAACRHQKRHRMLNAHGCHGNQFQCVCVESRSQFGMKH